MGKQRKELSLDSAINYANKYEVTVGTKAWKQNKTAGYSLRGSISKRVINALIVMALVITSLFAGFAMPANADEKDDQNFMAKAVGEAVTGAMQSIACPVASFNTTPKRPGLMQAYTGTNPNVKQTIYEKYGSDSIGYTAWTGYQKGKSPEELKNTDTYADDNPIFASGDCLAVGEKTSTAGSNIVLGIAKGVTWVGSTVLHTAVLSEKGLNTVIKPILMDITKDLASTLYLDFLLPMIMIAGLFLFYTGVIKRKTTKFISELIWVIVMPIVSMILLAYPQYMVDAPTFVKDTITGDVATTITQSSTDRASSSDSSNYCQVNDGDYDRRINNMRVIDCLFWTTFVYEPWKRAQFGNDPAVLQQNIGLAFVNVGDGANTNKVMLGNTVAEPQDWALVQLEAMTQHAGESPEVTQNKKKLINREADALLGIPAETGKGVIVSEWSANGNNKSSESVMSLIGSIGAMALLVILSISLLLGQIVLYFLAIMSPLIFLIGIIPGYGRSLVMKWVGKIVHTVAYQIFLSVYLFVIIAIMTGVMNYASGILGMILMIAITIGGIKFKKDMVSMLGLQAGEDAIKQAKAFIMAPRTAGRNFIMQTAETVQSAYKGDIAGAVKNVSKPGGVTGSKNAQRPGMAPLKSSGSNNNGSTDTKSDSNGSNGSNAPVKDAPRQRNGTVGLGKRVAPKADSSVKPKVTSGASGNKRVAPKADSTSVNTGSKTPQVVAKDAPVKEARQRNGSTGMGRRVAPKLDGSSANSETVVTTASTSRVVVHSDNGSETMAQPITRTQQPVVASKQATATSKVVSSSSVSTASALPTRESSTSVTNTAVAPSAQSVSVKHEDAPKSASNTVVAPPTPTQAPVKHKEESKASFLPRKTSVKTESQTVTFTSKVQGLPARNGGGGLPKAGGAKRPIGR